MPLFIDEAVDTKLKKKTTVIPPSIHNLALKVKGEYGNNKQQDGYKTINHLLDASYNKGKTKDKGISAKNDDAPVKDKNDGLVKFPTSAARKMIHSLANEKNFIDSQAKETIMSFLKTDVKSKESAVKDNKIVPKVPKLAKVPKSKPMQSTTKSTIVGGINATLHEGKKIVVNEAQILSLIQEYKTELNIPFNHDTPDYDYKENWEHYIDFLEEIGHYGQLPQSDMDKTDIEQTVLTVLNNDAAKWIEYNPDELDDYGVLWRLFLSNNGYSFEKEDIPLEEFLSPQWIEDNGGVEKATEVFMNDYQYIDPFEALSDDKLDEFKGSFLPNHFYNICSGDNGFPDGLTYNDRGLIYVERMLTLPNNQRLLGRSKRNPFIGSYCSLGECWTWAEGYSDAYEGENGDPFYLQGWVMPEEVDWDESTYRNCYALRNEQEIYIPHAKVEVFAVRSGGDKSFGLKRPILVEA